MTSFCRQLLLIGLEVALLVASILVGSYMLLLFFSVPLLLCFIICNLHLISPISLTYSPFYLVFLFFILLSPLYCLWSLLENFPCVLMNKWCFQPLPGLLFASLYLGWLIISRFSSVVELVYCILTLRILLSSLLGILWGPHVLSLYLYTTIRVHIVVGGKWKGWSFNVLHLQLSCQG